LFVLTFATMLQLVELHVQIKYLIKPGKGRKASGYAQLSVDGTIERLREHLIALKMPHPRRENVLLFALDDIRFSWETQEGSVRSIFVPFCWASILSWCTQFLHRQVATAVQERKPYVLNKYYMYVPACFAWGHAFIHTVAAKVLR
jgi:hypothetical protein